MKNIFVSALMVAVLFSGSNRILAMQPFSVGLQSLFLEFGVIGRINHVAGTPVNVGVLHMLNRFSGDAVPYTNSIKIECEIPQIRLDFSAFVPKKEKDFFSNLQFYGLVYYNIPDRYVREPFRPFDCGIGLRTTSTDWYSAYWEWASLFSAMPIHIGATVNF